jgi:hypothetical protein
MRNDTNGCSTCPKGVERWEEFSNERRTETRWYIQYDYREEGGELFSCVGSSLEECRQRRDVWLEGLGARTLSS